VKNMEQSFLYVLIKVLSSIIIFAVIIIGLNRALSSLEKKGIISSIIKKRIATVTASIIGVLVLLIIVYELSYHVIFLYLFLIIFAVSVASAYPILNNFYAYYTIMNTRQVISGVYFSIGKIRGRVKNVGYLYTQLLLDDGSLLYIPNNYMLKKPFRIYRGYGKIRARINLMAQAPVNVETIANKIEEEIRRNFRHLSTDSEISVIIDKVEESNISFIVEVEYVSGEIREKIVNNFIASIYDSLYEYSPTIEILRK
jgi:small-conductance mechanosensitive channel